MSGTFVLLSRMTLYRMSAPTRTPPILFESLSGKAGRSWPPDPSPRNARRGSDLHRLMSCPRAASHPERTRPKGRTLAKVVPQEGLEPPTLSLRIVLLFRWTLLHAG